MLPVSSARAPLVVPETLIFERDWATGWEAAIGTTPWFTNTPSFAGGSTGTIITEGSEKWLRISFVAGAAGSDNGMFFARHLPPESTHIILEYQFRLKQGLAFNHSGKFPGLSCWLKPVGEVADGTNGFSSRGTWDSQGKFTIYIYHMDQYMWVPYGDTFPTVPISTGTIHTVREEFMLNTIVNGVAQPDGMNKYWFDGSLVFSKTDLRLTKVSTVNDYSRISRLNLDIFFGGGAANQGPIQNDYVDIGKLHIWSAL